MPDEFASPPDESTLLPAAPPSAPRPLAIHPLDRPDGEGPDLAAEHVRIRLAWAKLLWLLAFLAVLLGISYLVPFIAENTQYAITRGRQRAEHDFALPLLADSPLAQISRSSEMVAEVVAPSVVHINTHGSSTNALTLPMGARLRGNRSPIEGQGSGFIVDAGGYILTNYHVVRDAGDITVSLADGRRIRGKVVGYDRETDIAVLKINADKLTPVRWGNSDDSRAGSLVWALGSPFGLEQSITSGILSAKNRAGHAGNPYQNFLQTDTPVNPGNSGGPLVNIDGRVIGVNTAIVGETFDGVSFAVPSNVAREVYDRLLGEGAVRRGWLGVALDNMTDQHAKDLGLARNMGAYIVSVVQNDEGSSPAADAGIERGDVVLRWNGSEIADHTALRAQVAKTAIGSAATVVIWRDGAEMTVQVTVGERPDMPN